MLHMCEYVFYPTVGMNAAANKKRFGETCHDEKE